MMKRIALAGLSALTLAGSFAGSASAADFRGNDWNRSDHRDNDRRDNDRRGDWRNGRHDQFNRAWRRGDRLPWGYERRFRVVDYRREHLRPPPRGYRYIRDGRGDTLLVGIATGVILGVILASH
jgi:Ni/Co efflux regulator RcnB